MKVLAISDLHGYLPQVEECDLLLIAGDLCPDHCGSGWPDPQGQNDWLNRRFKTWWETVPTKQIVATYGNHDFCGEEFNNSNIIVDGIVDTPAGTVYATPWSVKFGVWAFMKTDDELRAVYEKIPTGIDILVTHGPPFGHGDKTHDGEHVGSKSLMDTIVRVRPKIVVCGHIHEAYGKYHLGDIPVYNVSCVDLQYKLVRGATLIKELSDE